MKRFFTVLLLVPFHIYPQEVDASDILFLKIQELEGELATLRSELESQAYLIEKLLNEDFNQTNNDIPSDTEINSDVSTFRFEGINDSKSIDEVYDQAIFELNEKDFQAAKQSFNYLSNNFNDEEKESQILSPKTGLALQFVNGKAWIHDIVLLGSFGTIFGTGFLAKMSLIFFSIVLCLPFVMSWAAFGTLLRRIFTTP